MSLVTNSITMTSREMADLTEKRHDSVKRTIDTLAEKGVIAFPQIVETSFTGADGRKQTVTEYQIGKRDSYVIVAQLSPEFTARLVDRWQELESKQAFAIPQTFAQALMLAAQQAEQIEQQQALIQAQQPAVEFVDRFVEAKSAKGFREVAKILGIKEREFISELAGSKIIFKQGSNWLPMAEHQHNGYFTVKAGEANGHAFHQTRFTPEGIAWIAKRYSRKLAA